MPNPGSTAWRQIVGKTPGNQGITLKTSRPGQADGGDTVLRHIAFELLQNETKNIVIDILAKRMGCSVYIVVRCTGADHRDLQPIKISKENGGCPPLPVSPLPLKAGQPSSLPLER